MKKIIILAIATLSTGIVLSNTLKKSETISVKPISVVSQKNIIQDKDSKTPSFDALATGD